MVPHEWRGSVRGACRGLGNALRDGPTPCFYAVIRGSVLGHGSPVSGHAPIFPNKTIGQAMAAFAIGNLDYRQLELVLDFLSQSSPRRLISGDVNRFIFDPPSIKRTKRGVDLEHAEGGHKGQGEKGLRR
jgi:hypothetical protein